MFKSSLTNYYSLYLNTIFFLLGHTNHLYRFYDVSFATHNQLYGNRRTKCIYVIRSGAKLMGSAECLRRMQTDGDGGFKKNYYDDLICWQNLYSRFSTMSRSSDLQFDRMPRDSINLLWFTCFIYVLFFYSRNII